MRNEISNWFEHRSLDGLLRLLGFQAAGVRIDGVDCDVVHHGTRGTLACYVITGTPSIAVTARALRARNPLELQLYIFVDGGFAEIVIGSFAFGEKLLTLTLGRDRVHAADIEALQELMPADGEEGSLLVARYARAFDRTRVTRRFFAEFAAQRDVVARAWSGLPPQRLRDREQLALLLLSRLMFLYFLQHRGYLAGDRGYLARRFHEKRKTRRSFYAGVLRPLFFYALNRKPEMRPAAAAAFGELPYLNGGLFERHALERKHPRLDLPDQIVGSVLDDLLERYRFTAREAADAERDRVHDLGVDPEMLGRVFEGLMADRVRETTGTFYTPAATVDRVVNETLAAYLEAQPRTTRVLDDIRVIDPACGSGAFLLGALSRIAERRAELEGTDTMSARRDVVAHSLYGVDLLGDAALLAALRLWLALIPATNHDSVQPLPNLDRHIRQGDALIDPIDLRVGVYSAEIRKSVAALTPVTRAYVNSDPDERPALQRALSRAERTLARAWVSAHRQRQAYEEAVLKATTRQKDLFGALTDEARRARSQLATLRRRSDELKQLGRRVLLKGETPFFSFAVHFPVAALNGFDIVLCNPPWVRSHHWPRTISGIVKTRFQVCADGNQVDLALLFLERAIDLLKPGGALGIILPAKFMRSLSGASARRLLLERTEVVSVEDHSLDQRSIFNADAFAAVVVARKRLEGASDIGAVRVRMIRRGAPALDFAAEQSSLPFDSRDARSPWLLVPPPVARALACMGEGSKVGDEQGLTIRRGVVSGSNSVMLLRSVEPKLSGLALIRSEGHATAASPAEFEAIVEQHSIVPLVRGCDVHAWSLRLDRHMLRRCRPALPSPRLERYMRTHGKTLSNVPKVETTGSAVAWHDLACTMNAVVLPADVVALNTVYYIAVETDSAHLLCAYFNSLPVRTFARAIAERAKDAHFRFFAWTIAKLALPLNWRTFEAPRLRELSRIAHDRGSSDGLQAELDEIVARAFGLNRAHMRAIQEFDAWLRGS